jgi:hypothetical protein
MYALRAQKCGIAMLSGADGNSGSPSTPGANNQWSTMIAFGLSEGVYMIASGPSGDTIANAQAVAAASSLNSYAMKLMFGDFLYWQDTTNNVRRLVSPIGFTAGILASLSPEQSSLNKPLYSILGSQTSGLNPSQVGTYAPNDLQALFSAGIDVIANPCPGGAYFGVRGGINTSNVSSPTVAGDNYTRMTNYIATTLNAGMGQYVGQLINNDFFNRVRSTLLAFLGNMLGQGMLGLVVPAQGPTQTGSVAQGTLATQVPYSVVCDASDNPFSRTSIGYAQANVQVAYQAINQFFIVNLEGGQTVNVSTGLVLN